MKEIEELRNQIINIFVSEDQALAKELTKPLLPPTKKQTILLRQVQFFLSFLSLLVVCCFVIGPCSSKTYSFWSTWHGCSKNIRKDSLFGNECRQSDLCLFTSRQLCCSYSYKWWCMNVFYSSTISSWNILIMWSIKRLLWRRISIH